MGSVLAGLGTRVVDIPAGSSERRQRWPGVGTHQTARRSVWASRRSASVGERGLLVAGPAPHSRRRCEDDAAQAPLPAWSASGMGKTHHLTAVAHACVARTGFGIVASTTVTWGGSVVAAALVGNHRGRFAFQRQATTVAHANPTVQQHVCLHPETGVLWTLPIMLLERAQN